jgi:hypothetical protein
MRYETKQQTRIQILAPHKEPVISALQPQPPPSFRLGDTHTHNRAITKYTGALPSSRSTRTSHRLAHCCTRVSPTRAQCRTYYNSTSIASLNLNHLSLPTSPSLQSLCYRGRLHSHSDSYSLAYKYLRTRLDTPEACLPSFPPSFFYFPLPPVFPFPSP